jgi:NitT/TauT family transport system substrate-binding protein
VSVLLAQSKKLPIKIVAPGTFVRTKAKDDFSAIIAKKGGPRSAKDLEGKTLAVNTLKNVNDITVKESLRKQGVDGSKVRLLEVDFPDMVGAVQKGRVDAAFAIEPFVTQGLSAGLSVVTRPYVGTKPGLQIGCYFTSEQYLAKNKDAVTRFQEGVAETAKSVTDDPAGFRAFLPKAAKIPPAAAKKIVLPAWKAKSDPASIALTAELMQRYGVTKSKPDPESALAK